MKLAAVLLALGFVMPANSVLKRMAANRDELTINNLKVDGLLTIPPAQARQLGVTPTGPLTLHAALSVKLPGRCRLDVQPAEGAPALAIVYANGKKRHEGPELAELAQGIEQACAFLAIRSGGEGSTQGYLKGLLTALKVDTTKTSLGRFAGGVAVVLGSREAGAPQLWVSKERFLPVRVMQGGLDIRFLDYSSPSTGEWFPRVLEVHKDGALLARLTALTADGRADLNDVAF